MDNANTDCFGQRPQNFQYHRDFLIVSPMAKTVSCWQMLNLNEVTVMVTKCMCIKIENLQQSKCIKIDKSQEANKLSFFCETHPFSEVLLESFKIFERKIEGILITSILVLPFFGLGLLLCCFSDLR